jgi:hypothetical protein
VANPDLVVQKQEMRDFFEGKKDAKLRRDNASEVKRAEQQLERARARGGATLAVAANSFLQAQLSRETLGGAFEGFDSDGIVRLAEEAHKAAPSAATASLLEEAWLARASQALSRQEPEYAAMMRRAQRSLGSSYLVAVALWREGKPRQAALANSDVQRTLEVVRDQARRFPGDPSEYSWALLRAAFPDEAAGIAAGLKTSEKDNLERTLSARLSTGSASVAFRLCWAEDSAGRSKEALEPLRRCAADKVPLPFDVP